MHVKFWRRHLRTDMKKQNKILITGGSGFIGTNLIELLIAKNYDILNLDIKRPRNSDHLPLWQQCDILEYENVSKILQEFPADIIVHLAARTDLEGKTISDYRVNFTGVENIVNAANAQKSCSRLIFTSSLLVCKLGHIPSSDVEFNPDTVYGESKAMAEKIIRYSTSKDYHWVILRPTSIWGPWFSKPYKDFFNLVKMNAYFHPSGLHPKRTYGYVSNTVNQIYALFNDEEANGSVKYLGDNPPITVYHWAQKICDTTGTTKPKNIPYFIVYLASVLGSLTGKILNIPINLSRLKNMSTEAVYDVTYVENKAKKLNLQIVTFEEGVKETVNWLNKRDSF